MGLAVDGLISGLNTTDLINSLMQLEALPQTQLKKKVSGSQAMISALQGLNTKIASLATLATDTAKPAALDLFKATSSSTTATTAVRAGASAGQMNVVVTTLAQAQVAVSAAVSVWPDDPPVLTVVASDGTHAQVTGGTSINVLTEPGAATISVAQDAELTLWAGTTASQSISSSTNTFADVLPSVDLTVTAVSADPITLT